MTTKVREVIIAHIISVDTPSPQYMLPATFSSLPQSLLNGNERLMETSSVLYFCDHHAPILIYSNIIIQTIDLGISYTGSIG